MPIKKPWYFWIATGLGTGLMPRAPGTFGSLLGLLLSYFSLIYLPHDPPFAYVTLALCLALFVIAIAWFSIDWSEADILGHDDQRIVVDEVAGQMLACLIMANTHILPLLLSFGLFRLFDIWKPGPIGWADRELPGAWGTLIDDLIAGVVAGVITLAVCHYSPLFAALRLF